MFDYFYSDPHFGHSRVAEKRGFDNSHRMDAALVGGYCGDVDSRDVVLWLGDCFFCSQDDARRIMAALPGRKVLLRGNHDMRKPLGWYIECGFDAVFDGEMGLPSVGRWRVRACHLPYAGTPHARGADDRHVDKRPVRRAGEVLIHGHTHTTKQVYGNQIHVGVDAWQLGPAPACIVERLIESI